MNRDSVNNRKVMAITFMTVIMYTGISPEARGGEGGAFVGGLLGGHILTNMQNRSERRTRAQEQMAAQPRTVVTQQPAAAPASSGTSSRSVEDKLETLDKLAAGGYITKEEYKKRRQAILDSM